MSSTRSGTPILPTSCSVLAIRSRSASCGRHPELAGDPLADPPDAFDVGAGVLVPELGRLGKAADHLELGREQLGRAFTRTVSSSAAP